MVLAFGHLHHKSHATRQRTNTIHTHTEESVESQHKRVVCWSVTYLCSIAAYKNTRRVYIAMDWYPWLGRPTQNDMFRLRCCGECAVLFKVKNLDFVFTWLSFCAHISKKGWSNRSSLLATAGPDENEHREGYLLISLSSAIREHSGASQRYILMCRFISVP